MFLEKNMNNISKNGCIEVICGSMFSGKTEELIKRLKRAKLSKKEVIAFKPNLDVRYDDKKIISHNKSFIASKVIYSSSEILSFCENFQVVGIDEAQFFDNKLPEICNQLANNGTRVIVAGLDMDYTGKPFGIMPEIVAIADYVTKVHAICVKCGDLANYSHRISNKVNLVEIGEKEKYEPLCRNCFNNVC